MSINYRLYLVTGYNFSEKEFLEKIKLACKSGVTLVQLREKEKTTRDFFELAVKVKEITDRYHIPLIINDKVDICLAVDAAGVHIGDDELPVSVVRKLIGDKVLGVSAKTLEKSLEAQKAGADYLGVGAIFPTHTKDTPLTPLETLKAIKQQVKIPVVAIGGIGEERLGEFAGTAIDGVAIVSEIMLAKDIPAKVHQLLTKFVH